MHQFWYGYIKTKHAKVRYLDKHIFIIHIKSNDVYEGIANDVEKRFDISIYKVNRPLPTEKNKNVFGLMKDKSGGKIMTKFVVRKANTYSYLMDDGNSDKKAKGTKKCGIKRILKFNDYKNCLLNNEIILKSQQKFKSEAYNVYTEEVNYIVSSSNDDKRLKTLDIITTYPYGYKHWESMQSKIVKI